MNSLLAESWKILAMWEKDFTSFMAPFMGCLLNLIPGEESDWCDPMAPDQAWYSSKRLDSVGTRSEFEIGLVPKSYVT